MAEPDLKFEQTLFQPRQSGVQALFRQCVDSCMASNGDVFVRAAPINRSTSSRVAEANVDKVFLMKDGGELAAGRGGALRIYSGVDFGLDDLFGSLSGSQVLLIFTISRFSSRVTLQPCV